MLVSMAMVVNSCCTGLSVLLDGDQAECAQVWRDLSMKQLRSEGT